MTREKITVSLRKMMAFIMCVVVLVVSGVLHDYTSAYAATDTEDHGFEIDETLYNVNWQETKKIRVYQTVVSTNTNFKMDTYLGYAVVYTGFATTKKQVDGKYYQRILVEANMVPQTVSGKNRGMSQYLTVQVGNEKLMKNTDIQPPSTYGETSYSIEGSVSLGANIGYDDGVVGEVGLGLGITSSCSYTQGALKVITNEDDNGYATWDYDYISSRTNANQNAYLFGSSKQRGLFLWNMEKDFKGFYATLKLKVTATFGGGNETKNTRASNADTGANNLGSASTEMRIAWD